MSRTRPLLAFLLLAALVHAEAPTLESARALITAKRYAEARAALEQILAADPKNAAACHALGMVIRRRGDNAAFEEALKWLEKAAQLEPKNPVYLGDFGGTSLQFAGRTSSVSAATNGRDAMEKAVALKPDYLDAREGLFQFYSRAPWPIGSSAKANTHLEAIRKYDPMRAALLGVTEKVRTKDYAGAFKLCEEVIAKNPNAYVALYQLGRTASESGQQLERGLEGLKKCLTLDPPTPASPSHSNVWNRIGMIHERLNHRDEAKAAYESALKLDPSNQQAADALAKLK